MNNIVRRIIVLALVCLAAVVSMNSVGATPTVMTTIAVPSPVGVAVNPDTNRIYAVLDQEGAVSVINGATDTVEGSPISVGSYPLGVAANPVTNRIYVTNTWNDNVSVINGGTNTVVATVPVGNAPYGVGVNPATNLVYVTNYQAGTVSVVDGATNIPVTTIPVGSGPYGVATNPVTNRIYVGNFWSGTVSVIDGASNTVVGPPISVGSGPQSVAVNSDTNRIYVSNEESYTVSVIDGASDSVVTTIPVGARPRGVAVNQTTNRIFVANHWGDSVSVIDAATDVVVATVPVGLGPHGAAANPVTNRIYVSNVGDSTVSVIDDTPEALPPYWNFALQAENRCQEYGLYADAVAPFAFEGHAFEAQAIRDGIDGLQEFYSRLVDLGFSRTLVDAIIASQSAVSAFSLTVDELEQSIVQFGIGLMYLLQADDTHDRLQELRALCHQEQAAWEAGDLETVRVTLRDEIRLASNVGHLRWWKARSCHGAESAYKWQNCEIASRTLEYLRAQTVVLRELHRR